MVLAGGAFVLMIIAGIVGSIIEDSQPSGSRGRITGHGQDFSGSVWRSLPGSQFRNHPPVSPAVHPSANGHWQWRRCIGEVLPGTGTLDIVHRVDCDPGRYRSNPSADAEGLVDQMNPRMYIQSGVPDGQMLAVRN